MKRATFLLSLLLLLMLSVSAAAAAASRPSSLHRRASVPAPSSDTPRVGPCPGLELDSCECWNILHEKTLSISNMTDIVARNWWITLTYQDISHSFQRMLGTCPLNATESTPSVGVWPSVAAWASRVVGFGIRMQMLDETLLEMAQRLKMPQWFQDLTVVAAEVANAIFREVLAASAVALGGGNVLVFQEIGVMYSAYGVEFCADTSRNKTKMKEFVEREVCTDNCPLAQSMWSLWQAHFPREENLSYKERDELLLMQGMLTGLQEQTHLQPFLNASLPGYILPCWGIGNQCIPPEIVNTMTTEIFIHLFIGNHHMDLRSDVPSGVHAGKDFSHALSNLTLPGVADTMASMLSNDTSNQIDYRAPLNGTAAADWNELWQRMRFVAPLFWVFQDHPEVNCFVFTAEQENMIRNNNTEPLNIATWNQLCLENCCEFNGRWDGTN